MLGTKTVDLHQAGVDNKERVDEGRAPSVLPSALALKIGVRVFQHDNDPKHTTNAAKD